MKRDRRGQLDFPILSFLVVVVGLIIMAPIMLKSYNAIQDSVGPAFGNLSVGGNQTKANFDAVMNPLTNFWDEVMIAAFVFSVVILLISSFLIDTHPLWIVLYIVVAMFMIMFIPDIMQSADAIYDNAEFAAESSSLSFMDNLRTHMGEIIIGLFIITGIIIYGKINLFPSQGGGAAR